MRIVTPFFWNNFGCLFFPQHFCSSLGLIYYYLYESKPFNFGGGRPAGPPCPQQPSTNLFLLSVALKPT